MTDVWFRGDDDAFYKQSDDGAWEDLNFLDDLPIFGQIRDGNYSSTQFRHECYNILKRVTALLLTKRFTLYGDAPCVNHTGLVEEGGPRIRCNGGVPMMFEAPRTVRGVLQGPDPRYPHLTRLNASANSGNVQLQSNAIYLVHGPDEPEKRHYTLPTCVEVDALVDLRGRTIPENTSLRLRRGKLFGFFPLVDRVPTTTVDAQSRDGFFTLPPKARNTVTDCVLPVQIDACKKLRQAVRGRSGSVSVQQLARLADVDETTVVRLLLTDVRLRRHVFAQDACCLNLPEATLPHQLAVRGPIKLCDKALELVQGSADEKSFVFDAVVSAKKTGDVYHPMIVDGNGDGDVEKAPEGSWWMGVTPSDGFV